MDMRDQARLMDRLVEWTVSVSIDRKSRRLS
jgi:hypothetical protein